MTGRPWIHWTLLAAMVLVTGCCLSRVILQRGLRRTGMAIDPHAAASQALMGAGMAAMMVPGAQIFPAPVWGSLFGAGAAWLAWRAYHFRHSGPARHLHHVVGNLAMLYMVVAAGAHAGTAERPVELRMAGHAHGTTQVNLPEHTTPGFALPLLAWFFMIYSLLTAGFAATDWFSERGSRTRRPLYRGIDHATELTLGLGMAYMFLTML